MATKETPSTTPAPPPPPVYPTPTADPTMQRIADALEHLVDVNLATGATTRSGPTHSATCPFCGKRGNTMGGGSV